MKEIETIKAWDIVLHLSDEDCERITELCGEHNLTVGKERTATEVMKEDRCWFGMFPEPTLLNHLLSSWHDPEEYLSVLDDAEAAKVEKAYFAEEATEWFTSGELDEDIVRWEEELTEMRDGWQPNGG